MTLKFHFLNVGHGNATVIERDRDGQRFFGLIDTCASRAVEPRGLAKLKELGAQRLSFFAISHPHSDHFTGISQILAHFNGAIDACFLFPLLEVLRNKDRFRKLSGLLLEVRERLDPGSSLRATMQELLILIKWIDQNQGITRFCSGDSNELTAPGFEDVDIYSLLPPAVAKGPFLEMLDRGDVNVIGGLLPNEISTAFSFTFRQKTVLIGGDGTKGNWARRTRYERAKNKPIKADVVCLPHHGSANDCNEDVLQQLFPSVLENGSRIAISSGDGRMHPGEGVIKWLASNGISPSCTNLIPACGANIARLEKLPGVDPELARWVQEVSIDAHYVQACQGDIVVTIDEQGDLSTANTTGNVCIYRREFEDLFR